jgi:predicted ATPase/DNA-binding winged helix-turn-helix (wHTH) protein
MATLRIQTFGIFRVWRQGELLPDSVWPTNKCKALLKILLVARGRFLPADRLMELLWPDLSPASAQNSLWVAVSQLRRVLQPDLPPRAASGYIITSREGYAFNTASDFWLDVDAFTEQLRSARATENLEARVAALETARALYCGPFLEEDAYEDWAIPAREQLGEEFMALLLDLADAYARQGRYPPAINLCLETLSQESTREVAYRALMRYHFHAGEQAAALKAYAECQRVLLDELGVPPMAETTDLYEQILRGQLDGAQQYPTLAAPTAAPAFSLSRTPLVGRTAEYTRIRSAVQQVTAGQGCALIIGGEPGIGKSRLVQEAERLALDSGMRAFTTKCYQLEQTMPYQPVINVLHQVLQKVPAETLRSIPAASLSDMATLVPELINLVPGLAAPVPGLDETRQARLFRALVQLLKGVAGSQGLFLAVDDLHWADRVTQQFLHHLARQITDLPILLVCTLRSEELALDPIFADLVHNMTCEPQTLRLVLNRLTQPDALALLQSMAELAPQTSGLAEWLHKETDGNPFFIISILQSLQEQGLLAIQDNRQWQYNPRPLETMDAALTLPNALRESVRSRIRRVPPATHKVIEIAAVLGRQFDFATLQAVSGVAPTELVDMLDGLTQRELLREEQGGGVYDFSHDKVREVVYLDISATRRILLHRQVGEAMEQMSAGRMTDRDARLAEYFEHGHVWGKAVTYLMLAGNRACDLFAMCEAMQFYDRAIELAKVHPEDVSPELLLDVYEHRGRSRATAGIFEGAVADLELVRGAIQNVGNCERERDVLIRLGQVLRKTEEREKAAQYLGEAVALARKAGNLRAEADALYHLGTIAWDVGDNTQALVHHRRALEICRELGLVDQVAVQATHGMAEALLMAGKSEQADVLFSESLQLARGIGDKGYEAENLQMLSWSNLGTVAIGNYERAIEQAKCSLEISEASSLSWHTVSTLISLGLAQGCTGDYESGLANVLRANAIAGDLKLARFRSMGLDALGYLYLDLNLYELAGKTFQHGLEIALESRRNFWQSRLQADLAITQMRMGWLDVRNNLQEALELALRGDAHFHTVRCLEGLAEAALAHHEPQEAIAQANTLLALAQAGGQRENAARAHYWRGEALRVMGKLDDAEQDLLDALALAQEIRRVRFACDVHQALAWLYHARGAHDLSMHHTSAGQAIMSQIESGLSDAALRAGLAQQRGLSMSFQRL